MPLFELPKQLTTPVKEQPIANKIKLKKGQTVNDLIEQARKLVEEKLGKYRGISKCVTDISELRRFLNETQDLIALDTETTGLNTFTDELVGICLCNGKQSVYVPINHKNAIYNLRLQGQISEKDIREIFLDLIHTRKELKWIYHNAKFDLAVMRTFLGEKMPDPFWDTMLCA